MLREDTCTVCVSWKDGLRMTFMAGLRKKRRVKWSQDQKPRGVGSLFKVFHEDHNYIHICSTKRQLYLYRSRPVEKKSGRAQKSCYSEELQNLWNLGFAVNHSVYIYKPWHDNKTQYLKKHACQLNYDYNYYSSEKRMWDVEYFLCAIVTKFLRMTSIFIYHFLPKPTHLLIW